ncbi:hypothetical protein DIPPA_57834 [Diplonema papillatum]|nr:hypothetical protein DIPPA_57834 [Diplonema papillatum]
MDGSAVDANGENASTLTARMGPGDWSHRRGAPPQRSLLSPTIVGGYKAAKSAGHDTTPANPVGFRRPEHCAGSGLLLDSPRSYQTLISPARQERTSIPLLETCIYSEVEGRRLDVSVISSINNDQSHQCPPAIQRLPPPPRAPTTSTAGALRSLTEIHPNIPAGIRKPLSSSIAKRTPHGDKLPPPQQTAAPLPPSYRTELSSSAPPMAPAQQHVKTLLGSQDEATATQIPVVSSHSFELTQSSCGEFELTEAVDAASLGASEKQSHINQRSHGMGAASSQVSSGRLQTAIKRSSSSLSGKVQISTADTKARSVNAQIASQAPVRRAPSPSKSQPAPKKRPSAVTAENLSESSIMGAKHGRRTPSPRSNGHVEVPTSKASKRMSSPLLPLRSSVKGSPVRLKGCDSQRSMSATPPQQRKAVRGLSPHQSSVSSARRSVYLSPRRSSSMVRITSPTPDAASRSLNQILQTVSCQAEARCALSKTARKTDWRQLSDIEAASLQQYRLQLLLRRLEHEKLPEARQKLDVLRALDTPMTASVIDQAASLHTSLLNKSFEEGCKQVQESDKLVQGLSSFFRQLQDGHATLHSALLSSQCCIADAEAFAGGLQAGTALVARIASSGSLIPEASSGDSSKGEHISTTVPLLTSVHHELMRLSRSMSRIASLSCSVASKQALVAQLSSAAVTLHKT